MVQMIAEYICDSYGRIQFMESVNHSDPILAAELYMQKHYTKKLTVASVARSRLDLSLLRLALYVPLSSSFSSLFHDLPKWL